MMLEFQQQKQQQQAAGSERVDNGTISPASVSSNWINVRTAPNVGYENDARKLTLLFGVEGLMCQKSCGSTIENALRSLPFVTFAKASYKESLAVVSVDSGKLDGNEGGLCDRIVECVEDVGFGCTPISLNDTSKTAEVIASTWELKEEARNHHDDDTETSHRLTSATTSSSSSSFSRSIIFPSEKETSRALRNNSSNNNKVTATIQVKGMSCATCAKRVDKAIREEDKRGVNIDLDDSHYLLPSLVITDVSVNISTGRVRVTFADSSISADEDCSSLPPTFLSYNSLKEIVMEKCINPIIKIGYQGEILFLSGYASSNGNDDTSTAPIGSDPDSNANPLSLLDNARHMESVRQQECDSWLRLFTYSACLTTPIVALSMYRMYDRSSHSISYVMFTEWLILSLASTVQVVIGRRYYIAAYRSFLYSKMLGMDSLVVLGSTSGKSRVS
jgi:cation transport ATPase